MRDRDISGGGAFVTGVLAGLVIWSAFMFRARRHLFGDSALQRFAALGYLGGQPSVETARLLQDYVHWETRPRLRRRGEQVLRRMELYLE